MSAGEAGLRDRASGWLRSGRGGLFALAVVTGAGAGLGAEAFRYLISFFTWLRGVGCLSSMSGAF
jgi:hypothetical protein